MDRLKPEIIAARISDAVLHKHPFSYIRYNDGEAMFMTNHSYCEQRFYGGMFPEPFRTQLKNDMRKAYLECDILGSTEKEEKGRSMYYTMSHNLDFINTNAELGSACDPIYWHDNDLYDMMLHGTVNIITQHDVEDKFEQRFGMRPNVIKILRPQTGAAKHIADYAQILDLEVKKELYFVSWSLLGKATCGIIKERGGVAVDIGAIIDGWMGWKTRSYHSEKYRL